MREDALEAARLALATIPRVWGTMRAEMRRSGLLSPQQMRVLGMLSARPRTLTELASAHEVRLPTMSATVSAMERNGWVSRVPDPSDRRRARIEITPAGRDALRAIHKQAEHALAPQLERLPEEEIAALKAGLEVLGRALPPGPHGPTSRP